MNCIGLMNSIRKGVFSLRRAPFWLQLLFSAFFVSAAYGESPKQMWVLQEPDEIVAYDITTFASRSKQKVPRIVLKYPENLSVNARGQMLFFPPESAQRSGEMASDRVWFWNGHEIEQWNPEVTKSHSWSAERPTTTETALKCFLSAGGESIFWFENKFEKVRDESGLERSVRTTSRVWRTDLARGNPETITSLSAPEWCRCGTGVCSETCPEWDFWVPDGVVGDFFLVTRFTPGQLGSEYHESLLYQHSGTIWQVREMSQPIQRPLAASKGGEMLVAAVPDGGCCGWENESDDQTLLIRKGQISVLYDESDRYGNRDYDLSFYTADARSGPRTELLAYTVVSTAGPATEIRLSSEAKDNAEELTRIRKAIAELPAVEVIQLGIRVRTLIVLHHANLVGWLNDSEILVVQGGRLAVYDIRGTKRKQTTIQVRSATDVFLR
jgi:hypothetical protein